MLRHMIRKLSQIKEVKFTWVTPDEKEVEVIGKVGETFLENAHRNSIDLEGACDGSLACSTCHIILNSKFYDLQSDPTADEDDMLDLAFGLTPTSRLGCQIKVSEQAEGTKVQIPKASVNLYVDGHKPKPH